MVVSAKNGSIAAVTGSGIRHMSDSLIAFQPAIDEPSNIKPSAKVSSSIMPISKVTCCHLPRGSVKRRSTYLTSLSLIDFRTSLAVFMNTPFWLTGRRDPAAGSDLGSCSLQLGQVQYNILKTISGGVGGFDSDGIQPGFPCSDPNGFLDVGNEDLSVPETPRLGRTPERVGRPPPPVIPPHDLHFYRREKDHDVFRAAVEVGVAF